MAATARRTKTTRRAGGAALAKRIEREEGRIERDEEEILRRKRALVALRHRLPPVEVRATYAFRGSDGRERALVDLFGEKDDLIVVHHMGPTCPYCALWSDAYQGVLRHLEERAAFVVAVPVPVPAMRALAKRRGWTFRLVSAHGTPFFHDMGFEPKPRSYMPGVSTFHRTPDGRVLRVGKRFFGPGDDFCGVWHFFDLLRDGPSSWQPTL